MRCMSAAADGAAAPRSVWGDEATVVVEELRSAKRRVWERQSALFFLSDRTSARARAEERAAEKASADESPAG